MISKYNIKNVLSYQESGTLKTWDRDKCIRKLFKSNNVKWIEFKNQGIIRGASNRIGWDKQWHYYVNSSIVENKFSYNYFKFNNKDYLLEIENFKYLKNYPQNFQPAGQKYALKYLNSFVKERAKLYNYNISNPEMSRFSCSRLSTYLAWGNISVRFIYQYIKNSSNFKK